ncbi:MAG TPA: DMT family transporter [Desulfovibrio sp.]|uniref:DMT family transporter n=1 Tax=Desulfovibrio sp. TaxID=885 RepID=UPI002BBB2E62|nr:DMT family transporter [Desulfovibrio sp.]HMM38499.1 DMT family transporter [Desulfovibrio sp.]
MDDQRRAYLCGGLAVLVWSTVATAFKIALRTLDPLQLLLLADAVSILALLAVLAARGRLGLLRAMSRREKLLCCGLGLLNPFLYYVVLFQAYALLPAQEAQPLNYTWAVTLSLLAVPLLGQRLRPRDLAAILVSYAGVVVISCRGDLTGLRFSNPQGVALALGSTLLWALYWIGNTRLKADPVAALLLNFLAAFPCILAATLAFSALPPLGWAGLLAGAYVGLFEMGLTFVLWLSAMRLAARTPSGTARVANLIFLSPFLSLVFIHFLLGEAIRALTLAGLVCIIAGNALQQTGKQTK